MRTNMNIQNLVRIKSKGFFSKKNHLNILKGDNVVLLGAKSEKAKHLGGEFGYRELSPNAK